MVINMNPVTIAQICEQFTVADPGFPIGGAPSHWGGH